MKILITIATFFAIAASSYAAEDPAASEVIATVTDNSGDVLFWFITEMHI